MDLDGGTIRVAREWDDQERELDEAKSEAGTRTVPVLDVLARELRAPLLRTGRRGDALVFGRTDCEPFIPSTVRSRALAAWKRKNARRDDAEPLSPISLHSGRHTCASAFIAADGRVTHNRLHDLRVHPGWRDPQPQTATPPT